jgi:hypothetical protein
MNEVEFARAEAFNNKNLSKKSVVLGVDSDRLCLGQSAQNHPRR